MTSLNFNDLGAIDGALLKTLFYEETQTYIGAMMVKMNSEL